MSASGVTEVKSSAEPGDAAGAWPGQERHKDRGEDQQQTGASGQALKCLNSNQRNDDEFIH